MSSRDSRREIISLREEVARQGATIVAFEDRVTRLRAERDGARSEASELARKLEEANADLTDLKGKLSDQEKKIERQATTIKVQSEQIAAPREARGTPRRTAAPRAPFGLPPPPPPPTLHQPPQVIYHQNPQTPSMHTPSMGQGRAQPLQGYVIPSPAIGQTNRPPQVHPVPTPIRLPSPGFSSAYPGPNSNVRIGSSIRSYNFPPVGSRPRPLPPTQGLPAQGLPTRGFTSAQNWTPNATSAFSSPSTHSWQQPVSHFSHQNSSTQGSIVPYQPNRYPSVITHPQNNAFNQAAGWSIDRNTTPTQSDFISSTSSLNIRADDRPEFIWSSELANYFKLTEEWASKYTKVPNQLGDGDLGPGLMTAFSSQAEPEHRQSLLSSGATRYFMIARMLNTWVTGDILKAAAFKPFWPGIDEKAGELKPAIEAYAPVHVVSALLYDLSSSAKEMRGASGFQEWIDHQVHWRCFHSWAHLKQILDPGIEEEKAWNDLVYLFLEAYRLSVLMMVHPLPFKLTYPPPGRNSMFDPATMLNRDPIFRGDPPSIVRQGMRIRLAITPSIMTTDYAAGSVTPQTCHHANVLLQR